MGYAECATTFVIEVKAPTYVNTCNRSSLSIHFSLLLSNFNFEYSIFNSDFTIMLLHKSAEEQVNVMPFYVKRNGEIFISESFNHS